MSVRLFVGNLPYDVTETEIREFFAPVGRVSRIFLPVDRETGKQRGFAFVEFGSQAESDDAIRRMNDQQFKGRSIAVKEARERESRPAGGGNGSYAGRPASTTSRPPRPLGPGGSYPSARPAEDLTTPTRRRSFGPAARPVKRRPQQNRPHKSEWGKRAFRRERLRDDNEEDLNLYTAADDGYDSDADTQNDYETDMDANAQLETDEDETDLDAQLEADGDETENE